MFLNTYVAFVFNYIYHRLKQLILLELLIARYDSDRLQVLSSHSIQLVDGCQTLETNFCVN